MWKAGSGVKVEAVEVEVEDDWETDADFVVRAVRAGGCFIPRREELTQGSRRTT